MVRVAVVTGGTRGIGAAISKALHEANYKVAATYHGNDEAAKNLPKPREFRHSNSMSDLTRNARQVWRKSKLS